MSSLLLDGFLAEFYAAWPLHFTKPASVGYRCSILELRSRFRTNDRAEKRLWRALIFRLAIPKTLEIEWRNNEMP
jgi:hypothetical protein